MSHTTNGQQSLHIALFTYSTKPRGGVVHTLALAEALQALGHAVHVYALGKDRQGFFRPVEVPHTLIPFESREDEPLVQRVQRYIETYYRFLRARSSEPFDVYHAQDCISANALWRLREEGRIPAFIRTVHHVDDFTSEVLIRCQRDSILRPDHRVVVSRYWQDRLRRTFDVESHVIYSGVDLQRFQPASDADREAARAALDLTDEVAFLSIGGIEPRKNTIRLLHAFEEAQRTLAAQGRRSVWLLVGGDTLLDYTPYRTAFFEQLERSGLREGTDIRLLGVVDDERIPVLYHAADLLVFPSVKEGWGLVNLEAMASGVPVLTSDLPVFREYLRSEENALLVDPEDESAIAAGIVRLAQDETLRRTLAKAGPVTAASYSWETTAEEHTAYYRRHIAEHNLVSKTSFEEAP